MQQKRGGKCTQNPFAVSPPPRCGKCGTDAGGGRVAPLPPVVCKRFSCNWRALLHLQKEREACTTCGFETLDQTF